MLFKEIKPDATIKDVIAKINSLKSNYRKELKKITHSKRSGAGAQNIYNPKSWVFHMLNFLNKNEKPVNMVSRLLVHSAKYRNPILGDVHSDTFQLLKTQLSLATIDPVEFAYVFTGKPGYTGVTIGEQVHVIQWKPVHVALMKLDGCFNEMPVNYSGSVMYMGPKNHILQKTPTPVSCSVLIKPSFYLSG